jgi:hypothetical protein
MHKDIENATYCILDDEFEEVILISFLNPIDLAAVNLDEFANPTYCLNAVISDQEDCIECPTKRKRIMIADRAIPRKIYENMREVVLFMDPEAKTCAECLYKAFISMIRSLEEED